MGTSEQANELIGRLEAVAPKEGVNWLQEAYQAIKGGDAKRAQRALPAAARKVGKGPLNLPTGACLEGVEDNIPLAPWSIDEAARVVLLLGVAQGAPQAFAETVRQAYEQGDTREQMAVIRGLPLFPDAGRFVEISLDAGRTNDTNLFTAVACDNPYASRRYPELEFNKLVMKAVFVGAPVDRILGLERRANPELARMGMEYIDQQESATRKFPPELWLAIAPCPPAGAVGRMLGYLSHSVVEHRLWAARALARVAQERTRPFLEERARAESDPAVNAALGRALEAVGAVAAGK